MRCVEHGPLAVGQAQARRSGIYLDSFDLGSSKSRYIGAPGFSSLLQTILRMAWVAVRGHSVKADGSGYRRCICRVCKHLYAQAIGATCKQDCGFSFRCCCAWVWWLNRVQINIFFYQVLVFGRALAFKRGYTTSRVMVSTQTRPDGPSFDT